MINFLNTPNFISQFMSEDDTAAVRDEANRMGLLSAAAQILQASAPTTTPSSLGSVIGQGFMAGQQAAQNVYTNKLQDFMATLQLQQTAQEMKEKKEKEKQRQKIFAPRIELIPGEFALDSAVPPLGFRPPGLDGLNIKDKLPMMDSGQRVFDEMLPSQVPQLDQVKDFVGPDSDETNLMSLDNTFYGRGGPMAERFVPEDLDLRGLRMPDFTIARTPDQFNVSLPSIDEVIQGLVSTGDKDNIGLAKSLNELYKTENYLTPAVEQELVSMGIDPSKATSADITRAMEQIRNRKPKYSQSVMDELAAMGVNPGEATEEELETALKNVRSGRSTTINVNTEKLSKKSVNTVQAKLINIRDERARLKNIEDSFDPKFLKFKGRAQALGIRLADKFGLDMFLSPKNREYLRDYTKFSREVLNDLNLYIKSITGAAMTQSEAERIEKARLSLDMSPLEFEAALKATLVDLETVNLRYEFLLANGLTKTVKTDKGEIEVPDIEQLPLDQFKRIYNQEIANIRGELGITGRATEEQKNKIAIELEKRLKRKR